MRAAPPAGGIGGVPPVGGPGVALIFLQSVKDSYILREAHRLKGTHVLPAGEYIGTIRFSIDFHDGSDHKFFLIQL